ncbi:MFS transporter [Aestuariivirga sp.]|uniref:MFS transporter n=1 Tax=Aestuariivirga sp. TaxID=2650926 RepID=UPI0025C0F92D|nr:MFS transporter [Aestuariivirga sp.]MCA3554599.1 MFS transporter [Aestuariivirga sp.]
MTAPSAYTPDSRHAWIRLFISLVLAVVGGIGLWLAVVVLPTIQAEFGVDRAGASFPYTATFLGFAAGGFVMGKLADRFGITVPITIAGVALGAGFFLAAISTSYWQFVAVQAVFIGFLGSAATFGPLVADASQWFLKRRGIAIAIVASGNYIAGAIWPPFMQAAIQSYGWRWTYMAIGVLCVVVMVPGAQLLRKRPHFHDSASPASRGAGQKGLLPRHRFLFPALVLAGLSCCVAMSMPQVHIVAYCADLGYGPARGAEMLSIMLGFGVLSRLVSGLVADKLGGLTTLIAGSAMQTLALIAYIPFDGLASLYVVSAIFGLSQGGIVPSYALIIRDHFPAREAGTRISTVLTATVFGMALGGWMSGEIYDWTGSYTMAFLNGVAWNVLNLSIALWILFVRYPRSPSLTPAAA